MVNYVDFYGLVDEHDVDTWADIAPQSAPIFSAPKLPVQQQAQQEQETSLQKLDDAADKDNSNLKIKLNSPQFDAKRYISSQMNQMNFEEFSDAITSLRDELEIKERGLKSLVRGCFDQFVMAKGHVDVVYGSFDDKVTLEKTSKCAQSLSKVGAHCNEVYGPLLDRKRKADLVRYTIQTLVRFQSLFGLPASLFKIVQQVDGSDKVNFQSLDFAIREISRGKLVFLSLKDNKSLAKVFNRVWTESDKASEELVKTLLKKLSVFNEDTLLDDKERILFVLNDLFSINSSLQRDKILQGQDADSILISGLHVYILQRFKESFDLFKEQIYEVADGFVAGIVSMDKQSASKVQGVKFSKALMLASLPEKYRLIFQADFSCRAWVLVETLNSSLAQIMTGIFSELCRICRNYVDGKYGGSQTVSHIKQKRDVCNLKLNQILDVYSSTVNQSFGYVIFFDNVMQLDQASLEQDHGETVDQQSIRVFCSFMQREVVSVCVFAPAILKGVNAAFDLAQQSVKSVGLVAAKLGVVDAASPQLYGTKSVVEQLQNMIIGTICQQWVDDVATIYKFENWNLKQMQGNPLIIHSSSVDHYVKYQILMLQAVSDIVCKVGVFVTDELLQKAERAFDEASLVFLDGFHLLAVNPHAATEWTQNSQAIDNRLQILLFNISAVKHLQLNQLNGQLQSLFGIDHSGSDYLAAIDHLYNFVLKLHLASCFGPITDILAQGILYGGSDWKSEKLQQLKVHGYVNESLLRLALLFSGKDEMRDLTDIPSQISNTLLVSLLEQLHSFFSEVDEWSYQGCLSALVDLGAYHYAIKLYIDQNTQISDAYYAAFRFLQDVLGRVNKSAVPQDFSAIVDKAVKDWRKRCDVLVKCFLS